MGAVLGPICGNLSAANLWEPLAANLWEPLFCFGGGGAICGNLLAANLRETFGGSNTPWTVGLANLSASVFMLRVTQLKLVLVTVAQANLRIQAVWG